jgi:outer membrane lipase/esterase
MNFHGEARRGLGLRATLFAIVLASVALLAACGGGSRSTTFVPGRVLSFGDENSMIVDTKGDSNGVKYGVNYLNDDLTNNCTQYPIWNEVLAQQYGIRFTTCDPTFAGAAGRILATNGARVSEVTAQIDGFLGQDVFRSNDLVTVMAGYHDVLELYAQYPQTGQDALVAEARARGVNLANQVNRIANAGGKVIISTIFDLGYSPYAANERATHTDTNRASLISALTSSFNTGLRVGILNDGRKIGLILVDELMTTIIRYPTATTFINIGDPVCDATLARTPTGCTTATIVSGGDPNTWMWADQTHVTPAFNSSMGSLAATRALNNPF